ncbi:MAG: pilus assembly protein PilM [Phycisphaerales bacterium]|nr:pilus assembly protein PilM [Phycisphaerales bacterium]
MTLRTPRSSPIGLDIGERWVKAIQLERAGATGPWRIAASARFRRREAELTDAEVARIEEVLHRLGFTGRRIVMAARPRSLTSATITMPPASSGAPLDQIARAELARIARRDVSAVEVGWWPVPAPAGSRQHESTHAMAAACARAGVEEIVAQFEAPGLEIEALDAPAWALARAARHMLRAEGARPEMCAVLDLGHSLATLVALRDGVPVYERSLEDLGVGTLEEDLRKKHGVSEEVAAHVIERIGAPRAPGVTSLIKGADPWSSEADEGSRAVGDYLARVAREIAASITYLTHRYPAWPVEAVLCAGGGALIPGACEWLGQQTGLSTRPAALAGLFRPGDEPECPPGDAALFQAAGLALYTPEGAE